MTDDIAELKQLIIHNLDITDFLDIIGLDLSSLVDLLEEEIDLNYIELMKAVS